MITSKSADGCLSVIFIIYLLLIRIKDLKSAVSLFLYLEKVKEPVFNKVIRTNEIHTLIGKSENSLEK
jgi:hypothetical protein